MLIVLESVHGGIKGKVVDQDGNPLYGAVVEVVGKEKNMTTSKRGEFWRMLLPGSYSVKATHKNLFGVIESDLIDLSVINSLGQGALEVVLKGYF